MAAVLGPTGQVAVKWIGCGSVVGARDEVGIPAQKCSLGWRFRVRSGQPSWLPLPGSDVKLSATRGALESRFLPHANWRDVRRYRDPFAEGGFGASEEYMACERDDISMIPGIWSPRRLHESIKEPSLRRWPCFRVLRGGDLREAAERI